MSLQGKHALITGSEVKLRSPPIPARLSITEERAHQLTLYCDIWIEAKGTVS
jgi:hypothetical protein